MGSMESMIPLLQVLIFVIFFIMFILIGLYVYLLKPKAKKDTEIMSKEEEYTDKESEKKNENYGRFQSVLTADSIYDFMEFDEIVDNMIVRKKGTQYIMILQCNGVNYDLMSEQEKISVEEGFVQFLNTLRFPIQLYIQSRTLNLRDIIATYKSRVDTLATEIDRLDSKIAQAKAQGNRALREKLEFERKRKVNVLEYGINITDYVEKLSSNKNVLQQKTYVVVSYYSAEMGGGLENYSKEEIYNMCFSELYTRCQNIASALATSQITSNILDSEELAELLYIAYNRDDAELLQFSKALDSQYDALYSTGKDVLQKKQEKLDREINLDAIDIATDSILKADKMKQQEDMERQFNRDRRVKEKALELLDTYEDQLDSRVYKLAKKDVENTMDAKLEEDLAKEKEEEKAKNGNQPKQIDSPRKIVRRKMPED